MSNTLTLHKATHRQLGLYVHWTKSGQNFSRSDNHGYVRLKVRQYIVEDFPFPFTEIFLFLMFTYIVYIFSPYIDCVCGEKMLFQSKSTGKGTCLELGHKLMEMTAKMPWGNQERLPSTLKASARNFLLNMVSLGEFWAENHWPLERTNNKIS